MNKNVEFHNFVHPACLNTDFEKKFTSLIATGWGITDPDYKSKKIPILQKVNLTVINFEKCKEIIGRDNRLILGLHQSQLCTNDFGRRDICRGDSGGPLQSLQANISVSTIIGIISSGVYCATNVPSLYTNVSYYLDWIENIVWPI